MGGEEAGRLDQEPGCGGGLLVGQDLAERNSGSVIDRRVKVVVADAPASGPFGPAMDAVATTIRDAAQLLDVQVDQLTRVLALVADHDAAGAVAVGKPTHAVAAQHPIDRRAGHPEVVAEPMGALAAATPSHQHPTHLTRSQRVRAAVGSRRAIGQPGPALGSVAAQPLIGGGPRHPKGLGGLGGGQPSSVMRWTSNSRPNSVSRTVAWAMRVPSRLGVSTAQADRGDPQLSTTLTGTTPSSPSALSCWVEMLELDAGVLGREPPVDTTTGPVARRLPGCDLLLQGRLVGQAAV